MYYGCSESYERIFLFCVSELKGCKCGFRNITLLSRERKENRSNQKLELNSWPINKSAVTE